MNIEDAKVIRGNIRRQLRKLGQKNLWSNNNKSAVNVKTHMPIDYIDDEGNVRLTRGARYRLRQVVDGLKHTPCVYGISARQAWRASTKASVIISVYYHA